MVFVRAISMGKLNESPLETRGYFTLFFWFDFDIFLKRVLEDDD